MVTEDLAETTLLEDVWNTIDKSNQQELMDSTISVVNQIQILDLPSLS